MVPYVAEIWRDGREEREDVAAKGLQWMLETWLVVWFVRYMYMLFFMSRRSYGDVNGLV